MKPDAWMPFYIGDYLADTMHLSTVEHGAYLLLIMAYWKNGGPLPDDEEQLKAIAKLSQTEWQKHGKCIGKFFDKRDGCWRHARIDAELSRASRIRQQRARAGQRGASARWDQQGDGKPDGKPMASAMANASQNDAPSQSHIVHTQYPSISPLTAGPEDQEAVIPTVEEVSAYGTTVGVPPHYCRHYHDTCTNKHRWIQTGGKLLLWQRELKTWWETDRVKPDWNAKPRTKSRQREEIIHVPDI